MANNKAAWGADHAEEFDRIQAARAAAAVARDIADLRDNWNFFLKTYGASNETRAALEADFAALETLAFESADIEAFEDAWRALDEKIHALSVAAVKATIYEADAVHAALDGWLRVYAPALRAA